MHSKSVIDNDPKKYEWIKDIPHHDNVFVMMMIHYEKKEKQSIKLKKKLKQHVILEKLMKKIMESVVSYQQFFKHY